MIGNLIKCRFCNWQTQKWITNSKGKKIHGYRRLQNHVYLAHNEEYEYIRTELTENMENLNGSN